MNTVWGTGLPRCCSWKNGRTYGHINLEANLLVTECLLRDIRRHPRIRCALLLLSAGQRRTTKQDYQLVGEVAGALRGFGRQERSYDGRYRAGCSRQAPFLLCRQREERTLRDEVSRVRIFPIAVQKSSSVDGGNLATGPMLHFFSTINFAQHKFPMAFHPFSRTRGHGCCYTRWRALRSLWSGLRQQDVVLVALDAINASCVIGTRLNAQGSYGLD